MRRTGEWASPRGTVELDRIDDELFSTDYRVPTQPRHLTVLPEPPTVRLRPPVEEPPTVRFGPPAPPSATRPAPPVSDEQVTVRLLLHPGRSASPRYRYVVVHGAAWSVGDRSTGGWSRITYHSLRNSAPDEERTEVVALVGLAVLLIVAVTATVVTLWLLV